MKQKMTFVLALLLALIMSKTAVATTIIVNMSNPRVETSADGTTLKFYNQATGTGYQIESEYSDAPAWCSTKVTKVVIDPSFAGIYVTSTAHWFSGCTNLKTIEGLEYLKADSIKNANYMFYGCKSLTTLDLSGFNTYKLTHCQNMFAQCSNLKTIYGNTWSFFSNMTNTEKAKFLIWQQHHSEDNYMFDGCTSLVGGSGTKYNASIKNNDYKYCHVDGGTANPGFFTLKASSVVPYAVLDNEVLTLYYDNQRYGRVGTKYDLTFGENPDYSGNKTIKEVDIDRSMAGLTPSSTSHLFGNLYELYAIRHLENLNTSQVTDMSYMFSNCCSLGSIDLSGLNTSNVTNMAGMFFHCFALSSVNLSGLNTSNVTNLSDFFYDCLSLQSIDFSSFNTSKVTDMSSMFQSCLSLRTLNLSSFNTQQVTTMKEMFCECRNLRMLNISSFNTANVTDMSYMFSKCNGLQTLDLNNFNTAKVTNMMNMFGQPNLEIVTQPTPAPTWYSYFTNIKSGITFQALQLNTVDISSFNTANVTNMTSMFESQPALTTIYVGNSWSTVNVSQGNNMFRYSTELVGGSGTIYDGNHIDQLYAHVDGGTTDPGYLTLKGNDSGSGVKEAYAVVSGSTLIFYYDDLKNRRSGTKYDLSATFSESNKPGWTTDYANSITKAVVHTSMKDYRPTSTACWFYGLSEMTTIEGLRNLCTPEVNDMNNMFRDCKKIESLDVSGFNTTKVTNMRSMFMRCSVLKALDLRHFNTSKVTTTHAMFYECEALASLDISSFITDNVTDMYAMFYKCSSLTTLDVRNFNTDNVTNMEYLFMHCSALKTLELRNFKTTKVTTMNSMFFGCEALTSLNISTFTTDNVTNMYAMFHKCSALTKLDVSGFNTTNVTDMAFMFSACSSIKELCLGGFNTSNVTSMNAMFINCSALTTIYAKNDWNTSKVTNGSNMFTNCKSLVGGNGTTYNQNNITHTYAKIDGGTSAPGYFTNLTSTIPSGIQAYAMYSDKTLTFYYDNKANSRIGTKYAIAASYSENNLPRWIMDYYRRTFTKAVFDASFAAYRPTSTAFWFYNCSAMTSIEGISNLNTSQVTSMAEMFRYCHVLSSLDLSSFDTRKVTDMSCMFCFCFKLSSINISSFKTSNVTTMSHMFHCCPISSIDVSKFDTQNVTDMSIMFAECKNLKTLDLKNFNTANVTNMAWMFIGDPNLTTIYATDKWSTAKVTDSSYMFYGDAKLVGSMGTTYDAAHIDHEYAQIDGGLCDPGYLSGEYESNIPVEPYAVLKDHVLTFYYDSNKNCRDINDGTIYPVEDDYYMMVNNPSQCKKPSWCNNFNDYYFVTKAVFDKSFVRFTPTSVACWFYGFSNLKEIEGMENWNTSKAQNMNLTFWECNNLQKIDLNKFDTSEAITMSDMFMRCVSLTKLDVSNFDTKNVTDMFGMFSYCESLESLNLSNFDTSNVKNMGNMFGDCRALTKLNVNSFDTRKVESMERMFNNCCSLPYLSIQNFRTENVRDMNSMFAGCILLPEIDVSNFDTKNVTNMSDMFNNCSSLKEFDLTNFNTEKVINMVRMFMDCESLTKLNINSFNTSSVKWMYLMFSGCKSLKELDLKNFNTLNVQRMDGLFSNCSTLSYLDLNSFYPKQAVSVECMFEGCSSLEQVLLNNFYTPQTSGFYHMFMNCSSLKELDLSCFDTSNTNYMEKMFFGCSNLHTIFVNDEWDMSHVNEYSKNDVFANCISLIGGAGTKYDANHTDYTYARIDGGPSAPGYLTYKAAPIVRGDVNGDGVVDSDDIVTITNVMVGVTTDPAIEARADVNGDGVVNIGDIITVTNIIAGNDTGNNNSNNAPNGVRAVDLGLPSGTLWANMNVGATEEEDYGLYFAWGETKGHNSSYEFNWSSYQYGNSSSDVTNIGTNIAGTKYDAAMANWGTDWRMPSEEQFQELIDNTTNEWTYQNSTFGWKFTSKSSNNAIFFPAAGKYWGTDITDLGARGYYWSSTLDERYPDGAYKLYFSSKFVDTESKYSRPYGMSVRPVRKK